MATTHTTYPAGLWKDRWNGKPGTWRGGKTPKKRTALFCCPLCGEIASLSKHDIDERGVVSPSVVCPVKGCAFHEFIHLEGWKP